MTPFFRLAAALLALALIPRARAVGEDPFAAGPRDRPVATAPALPTDDLRNRAWR